MQWTTKDVVQLMIVLVSIFASWYNLKERTKVLETKVAPMYDWFIGRVVNSKAKSASNGG